MPARSHYTGTRSEPALDAVTRTATLTAVADIRGDCLLYLSTHCRKASLAQVAPCCLMRRQQMFTLTTQRAHGRNEMPAIHSAVTPLHIRRSSDTHLRTQYHDTYVCIVNIHANMHMCHASIEPCNFRSFMDAYFVCFPNTLVFQSMCVCNCTPDAMLCGKITWFMKCSWGQMQPSGPMHSVHRLDAVAVYAFVGINECTHTHMDIYAHSHTHAHIQCIYTPIYTPIYTCNIHM